MRREANVLTAKPRFPLSQILLIGIWPSAIKKLIYRLKGHRIGRKVSIGFGSVLCAEKVEIGDSVQIGFFTILRGRTIRLGDHVQIGALTFIDTPHVEIGEGSRLNEQVFVGGLQYPDSRFVVGRNCLIMQMCYINPCRSITIGDDSGIGVDCLLIGHSSWLNRFEGYPVDFQPIVIGNSVALAWRVTVLPGTKIGDGAVIGANSLVKETIPPRCLAVGFPARVVAKAPYLPRALSSADRVKILRDIIEEFREFLLGDGLFCRQEGDTLEVWMVRRGIWRRRMNRQVIQFLVDAPDSESEIKADVVASLHRIPNRMRRRLFERGAMWLDIEAKERSATGNELGEEMAYHFRRHGLRLLRVKQP